MHQAPTVQWKVSRTQFQGPGLAVLVATVTCVHGSWWIQSDEASMALVLGGTAALLACVLACIDAVRPPVGTLRWDGQNWCWTGNSGAARPGMPVVTMDLQVAMLVCWDFHGGGRLWFWLGRGEDSTCWRALRRALFAAGTATAKHPLHTAGGPVRVGFPR